MINTFIQYALRHRIAVLLCAVVLLGYGGVTLARLPVDVFPDLSRPTVTVLTEAQGLAPEEVETLVTIPLESVLNGMPGILRVRSSSGIGISIVFVEFDWGTDIYRNRQLVTERLQHVQDQLPPGFQPTMAPIVSLMGEIQFVGLTSSDPSVTPMDLRTIADWTVQRRLLTIPGVSQVITMGGQVKQYQIQLSSEKLQFYGITLEDLQHALSEISSNASGGFLDVDAQELLIRPLGRVDTIADIENSFVALHLGRPVLIRDIATVAIGPKVKRGDSGINGRPAVVMTIKKQPGADTVELSRQIDAVLAEMQTTLPPGITIERDLFKQSHFIVQAIHNVKEALGLGAVMVAIVLFLFLNNLRTTCITLCAIPLSFVITAIVFQYFGFGINTMTLGGLAIAIGELVDDAIVDVENVFRRLKENRQAAKPAPILHVIYAASSEVRNSIVLATVVVVLVFIPLFALSGIEGRLFVPLGVAYIVSLLASLVVSLTVTPVMCFYLLPALRMKSHAESPLVRWLKSRVAPIVHSAIAHPRAVLAGCGALLAVALLLLPLMGQDFLPKFNEGTATIGVATAPGISLPASDLLGRQVETAILTVPEVKSTTRRTGRAEMDEHAEGVYWNEIDVDFHDTGRARPLVLREIRKQIAAAAPHVHVNIGQPISHRLDHLLSGIRAQIAIKVFGPDLSELRRLGAEITDAIQTTPGLVDLQIEPLVLVPQLKIAIDREAASRHGIRAGLLVNDLAAALGGTVVGQVLESQQYFELVMRFDDTSRASPEHIQSALVRFLPDGVPVRVHDVASVYAGKGPNMINREQGMRRIAIFANADDRDLYSLVQDVQTRIARAVTFPTGYFVQYGGQYESQQQASRLIAWLGALSALGIWLVLYLHFRSVPLTLQIMCNIPLALIGSVFAIFLTERVLSLATLIAFITLCGIASRNGIMMISHYLHLVREEGEPFGVAMIVRGTLERLVPVCMTAFTAILALLPLVLAHGEPGKEILHPVAIVIVGGLLSSTLLDFLVTPALFYRYGRKAVQQMQQRTMCAEEIA